MGYVLPGACLLTYPESGHVLSGHGPNTPAIRWLIHYTGKQCDTVVSGGLQHRGVGVADLGHAGNGVGAGAHGRSQGDGIAGFQCMDFSEVIPHTPVVPRHAVVPVPGGGAGEMARPFQQGGAAGALVHLHSQADGWDFQCTQASIAVVEVRGQLGEGGDGAADGGIADSGIAGGRAARAGRTGEGGCPHSAGDQVAAVQRPARREVGRQELAGARQIAGGGAEAGRDQGAALAPVHVGVCPLVDGVIAGGGAEVPGRGGFEIVILGVGRGDDHRRQQGGGGQQGFPFHLVYSFHAFFVLRNLYKNLPPKASPTIAARTGRIISQRRSNPALSSGPSCWAGVGEGWGSALTCVSP